MADDEFDGFAGKGGELGVGREEILIASGEAWGDIVLTCAGVNLRRLGEGKVREEYCVEMEESLGKALNVCNVNVGLFNEVRWID